MVEVAVDPCSDGQLIALVLVLVGKASHRLSQLPSVRMMQAKDLSLLLSWKTSSALFAFSQTFVRRCSSGESSSTTSGS